MQEMHRLNELREDGRMRWLGDEHGWVARPEEIVAALADDGFEEYKREEARSGRSRRAAGGVWAGINTRTGAVASAIWVKRPPAAEDALVFIEVDGRPITNE
jgi:hypothetical protein